ncbi:sensor histidine kinase [Humidisolicoccus flavus]|uniref:sensor histidine kinase n=1 Tax=Humidisolicoccus flavus TaxID=3111414 RepID=UPI0032492ABA
MTTPIEIESAPAASPWWARFAKKPERAEFVFDAIIALILLLLSLPITLSAIAMGAFGFDAAFMIVVTIVLAAALLLRRIMPTLTLLVFFGAATVFVLTRQEFIAPMFFSVVVVLYSVGRFASNAGRWLSIVVSALGAILAGAWFADTLSQGTTWSDIFANWQSFLVGAIPALLLFVSSMLFGLLVQSLIASRLASQESANARLAAEVAAERAMVEEERTSIARDMHDVVAHSLAVVIAQANGARYTPDLTVKDESLGAIAQTAKSALVDVRGLLAQLRHSQAHEATTSFDDVPELVARMRATGLPIELEFNPAPVWLHRQQSIAAYRILQEALTNALRHGANDVVWVRVSANPDLVLEVTNRLRGAPGPVGHGLIGMRERAALAGGWIQSGQDGDKFRIVASFRAPEEFRNALTKENQ